MLIDNTIPTDLTHLSDVLEKVKDCSSAYKSLTSSRQRPSSHLPGETTRDGRAGALVANETEAELDGQSGGRRWIIEGQ